MSDNSWRIKKFYDPRVLLETQDVLDPLFPAALVCLDGSELYMLRNLCQYLHRRSTFVSEYGIGYYLAPTNEEWDELAAIVAQLEEKLMGCEDYLALLQCICDGVRELQAQSWPAGGVLEEQRDYDDYQSQVENGVGDPPVPFENWGEWEDYKCKAAQRIIDDLTNLGERLEVVYTSGAAITFAVFQTLVIGTAVAPPVALVLTVIGILAVAGTALSMIAFQNWLEEHKQALVCLIHEADTVQQARAAILAYVDAEWDLALGAAFAEHMFSWDVLSKTFDGGLEVSGYSEMYCVYCETEYGLEHEWNFPPDTNWGFVGPDAYYDGNGRLHTENLSWAYSPFFPVPPGQYDVVLYTEGCDSGTGNKCTCAVQRSDNGVDWFDTTLTWSPNFSVCPSYSAWGPSWQDVVWTWQFARYKIVGMSGAYAKHSLVQGTWTPD